MGNWCSSMEKVEIIHQRYRSNNKKDTQITLAYFGIEPASCIIVEGDKYYPAKTYSSTFINIYKHLYKNRGIGCVEFIKEHNRNSPEILSMLVDHTLIAYKDDVRFVKNYVIKGKMQLIFKNSVQS